MTAEATADTLQTRRPPNIWGHYVMAALLTAFVAWTVHRAAVHSASADLTGNMESLLSLTRLSIVLSPLVVAFRGGLAALIVWLACGAMNERLSLRDATAFVLLWLPLLDLPAFIDAIAVLTTTAGTWADAHISIGLDALVTEGSVRTRTLAHSLNLALLAWIALVASTLRRQLQRGFAVALPAATGAAAALVALPLLRG